jgi:hypothetical protein
MEELIVFHSEGLALEGLFEKNNGQKGVIITHPHPLYGGDMYNPVVETIKNAYQKKGYATLRFNFRGTGNSQGEFEDGKGEIKDLAEAVSFMKTRDISETEVAGYSFGVWVNVLAVSAGVPLKITSMVSPPVDFIKFPDKTEIPSLKAVITGSHDDYGSVSAVKRFTTTCNPMAKCCVIENSDHFYSNSLSDLEKVLMKSL